MTNLRGIHISRKRLLLFMFFALPLFSVLIMPPSIPNGASAASQNKKTSTLQSDVPRAAPVGDVGRGRALFMGYLHFEAGGPPCMGCHNIGSNGILGGGALGPDLTKISSQRSQPELQTILSNSETAKVPVMKPIYAEHPLTTAEQADLLAFINASIGQPEVNREWLVMGISLLGFLAAVGLIEFVYHGRLHGVRKPLVRHALSKKS
jgi:mono/diheme cytochrome c family protein